MGGRDTKVADAEAAAISQLARRARRVRLLVTLVTVPCCVGLGLLVASALLHEFQFVYGAVWGAIVLIPFMASGFVALAVARAIVRWNGVSWADALARRHGLRSTELQAYLQHM